MTQKLSPEEKVKRNKIRDDKEQMASLKTRFSWLMNEFKDLRTRLDDFINTTDLNLKSINQYVASQETDNVYGGVNAVLEYKKTERELKGKEK